MPECTEQKSTLSVLPSPISFETGIPTGLEFTIYATLAGQGALRPDQSLPFQKWDYKHAAPHSVLRIKFPSLCLLGRYITKTIPQISLPFKQALGLRFE